MSAPKPDYIVTRFEENEFATYGRWDDAGGQHICVTLEPHVVDDDNDGHRDKNVGRFQHGLYEFFIRVSHKNGGDGKRDYDVPQLVDVPDADNVQAHIGCFPWDSEACILVGTAHGDVEYDGETKKDRIYDRVHGKTYRGQTGSAHALEKLMTDIEALFVREHRRHGWIEVVDSFSAPKGAFA